MPRLPKRLCSKPGCRGLFDPSTGKCSQCGKRKTWHWKHEGNAQERGYDSNWTKLRNAYLAAYPLCEDCEEKGRAEVAVEVHHKMPFKGLDDPLRLDWDNLSSLCEACHGERTKRQGQVKPE